MLTARMVQLAVVNLNAESIGAAAFAIGLSAWLAICMAMRGSKPRVALEGQFFLLIATYSTLLLVLLAAGFRAWSDAATLASMYLILAAPFVLLILAAQLHRLRRFSRFHGLAFYAAAAYPALWIPIVGCYLLHALRWINSE